MRIEHRRAAMPAIGRSDREAPHERRRPDTPPDRPVTRPQDPVEPAATLEGEAAVPVDRKAHLDADAEVLPLSAGARSERRDEQAVLGKQRLRRHTSIAGGTGRPGGHQPSVLDEELRQCEGGERLAAAAPRLRDGPRESRRPRLRARVRARARARRLGGGTSAAAALAIPPAISTISAQAPRIARGLAPGATLCVLQQSPIASSRASSGSWASSGMLLAKGRDEIEPLARGAGALERNAGDRACDPSGLINRSAHPRP